MPRQPTSQSKIRLVSRQTATHTQILRFFWREKCKVHRVQQRLLFRVALTEKTLYPFFGFVSVQLGLKHQLTCRFFGGKHLKHKAGFASFHVMGGNPLGVERVYLQEQFLHW
jgi:hypothetical protein